MLLLGGWTVSSETDTQTTQANQLWGTDTDEQTVTDTGVQTGSELLLTAESDQQPTLSVVMPTLNEEADCGVYRPHQDGNSGVGCPGRDYHQRQLKRQDTRDRRGDGCYRR